MSQNDKTGQQKEWSWLYGKPVSEEELRQIQTNLSGFFSILKTWDEKDKNQNNEAINNEPNSTNR